MQATNTIKTRWAKEEHKGRTQWDTVYTIWGAGKQRGGIRSMSVQARIVRMGGNQWAWVAAYLRDRVAPVYRKGDVTGTWEEAVGAVEAGVREIGEEVAADQRRRALPGLSGRDDREAKVERIEGRI